VKSNKLVWSIWQNAENARPEVMLSDQLLLSLAPAMMIDCDRDKMNDRMMKYTGLDHKMCNETLNRLTDQISKRNPTVANTMSTQAK
jgi:hypothetical protein